MQREQHLFCIVKPVIKGGKLIYKRLALSQCIGSIMDICTAEINHKLAYINAHNGTGKVFTENHWKNARRPERKAQMLPIEAIEDTLLWLREGIVA